MATIDGNTVTIARGILVGKSAEAQVMHRPGVDGSGVLFGSKTDKPQQLDTIAIVDDIAAANTLITTYRALERTQKTIVDQFGRTFANVAIMSVQARPSSVISDDGLAIVVARWSVLLES